MFRLQIITFVICDQILCFRSPFNIEISNREKYIRKTGLQDITITKKLSKSYLFVQFLMVEQSMI